MLTTTILYYIHIGSLCLAALGILLADSSAMAWLLGKRETIDRASIMRSHWVVSIALAGVIGSGLFLFWPLRAYLITQPLFWLKMGFVAALVINSYAIERLMETPTHRPFRSLSSAEKLPFFLSGAVSTVSWLGAGLIALVLFS
ncbi:MAG TPA: hypothetical protein VMU25_04145 [Candidatus Paceibacterota bacterium]|nr:hypothetical protein [Candidatus Paceibacterota bacterium]